MTRRKPGRGPIPSELDWLIDELASLDERLRTLESPSGESLSSTVAKLQALVDDIQAQIDAWAAGRWTNAQITTQINATIASYTGNASISGGLTVGATVNANALITSASAQIGAAASVGTTLTVDGATQLNSSLRVPNAYGFDITYTRRTAWLGDDGRLGYASSSAAKKTAIEPAAGYIDLLAILDVEPKAFYYRAELARRTALRINEGIEYMPEREIGLIAQELDAAGLDAFVIYDADGTPEGIEYGMLTVALLAVARAQRDDIADLEARVAQIERGLSG